MKMRLMHVDALRGLAAIMVFLHHIAVNPVFSWIPDKIYKDIFAFGKYGVDIFFVISGYIIPYALFKKGFSPYKDFQSFFLKK